MVTSSRLFTAICILGLVAGTTPARAAAPASACPVTASVQAHPPDPTVRLVPRWFVNRDRTLWASDFAPYYAGGNKEMWVRSPGASLTITGHRLDGVAPPLEGSAPRGYVAGSPTSGFQPSGIAFPTPGCWQVVGQAAGHTLRFVVRVEPAFLAPTIGNCDDLGQAVADSTEIVVGTVTDTVPYPFPGFALAHVKVAETWKGTARPGDVIEVRQDTGFTATRMRPGRTYVLVLEPVLQEPLGRPWGVLCPWSTLAPVAGDRVEAAPAIPGARPLWSAGPLAALRTEIARLAPGR